MKASMITLWFHKATTMWKVSDCDTKDKVWCFMSGVWSKAIQGNQWCREYSWSILVCETLLNFGKKNISTNNLFSHDIYRKTVIKWYICTVPHNWDIFLMKFIIFTWIIRHCVQLRINGVNFSFENCFWNHRNIVLSPYFITFHEKKVKY